MYSKLIKNDVRKNQLTTFIITAFIFIATLLTALAVTLVVNLVGAIDNLMTEAKTPHFMQMHSGDLDINNLEDFAFRQDNVESFQVLEFLNMDGSEIIIDGNSLAGSVQDNGLSVQSKCFDFLLDMNGDIVYPADGEIYAPIYYMKEGKATIGDIITVHGTTLTVVGFIRDSQMNSALISSKRFLVSKSDFEQIRNFGKLEYLIEFRLMDTSDLSAFESLYIESGLEANGPPAITYPLFKLANGISDGIMIAVLILISLLIIVVTFFCIRFTLLAKIEEDYKQIGVLKAIGLRVSTIKKIYMAKYGAMAMIACILGFLFSLIFGDSLGENIRLFMGESNQIILGLCLSAISAVIIFLVVLIYLNKVLEKFLKISPAEAIRFGSPQDKSNRTKRFLLSKQRILSTNAFLGVKDVLSRKKLYVTMLLVVIVSCFIMIVPQNISSTISSRNFMTYMGIGNCDMRIDIGQTDSIAKKTESISNNLAQDNSITKYTVLTSKIFSMRAEDGTIQYLKVELGDHSMFPIEYAHGRAPKSETEIALSNMSADDIEKKVGDSIVLVVDDEEKHLTICGVYSDITNGGKTAKAVFETNQTQILWSTIPVELTNTAELDEIIPDYQELFSYAKVSDIGEYIDQTFGTTLVAIQKASVISMVVAVLLTVLITVLFMKMLVIKDRYSISILKSLGFTSFDIKKQYMSRAIIILILGVTIGTILSNTFGELVGVALISSFGASTFHFEVNPLFAYVLSPLIIGACIYIATLIGISDVSTLKVSEHIKE